MTLLVDRARIVELLQPDAQAQAIRVRFGFERAHVAAAAAKAPVRHAVGLGGVAAVGADAGDDRHEMKRTPGVEFAGVAARGGETAVQKSREGARR